MTPQVSYLKAIDLWVFVCLAFVFSSITEYGLILHLTSRSSWQRKIDQLHNEIVERKPERNQGNSIIKRFTSRAKRTQSARADIISLPKKHDITTTKRNSQGNSVTNDIAEDNDPWIPMVDIESSIATTTKRQQKHRWKENLAYNIEFYIKIVYPSLFLVFNVVYWIRYS